MYVTCTIWPVSFGTLLVVTALTQTSRQVPVPVIISYFCNNVAGVTVSVGKEIYLCISLHTFSSKVAGGKEIYFYISIYTFSSKVAKYG